MYISLKQFKTQFIIIITLFVVFSCDKKDTCLDKEVNTGIILSDYDMGKCFYFLDSSSYVINNLKEYQYLVDQIDSAFIANIMPDCAMYELYSIDFSDFTLLAQYAEGRGCSTAFQRDVEDDTENKQYVYKIIIYECGDCDRTEISMNWVKVPKLPEDYSVKFEIVRN